MFQREKAWSCGQKSPALRGSQVYVFVRVCSSLITRPFLSNTRTLLNSTCEDPQWHNFNILVEWGQFRLKQNKFFMSPRLFLSGQTLHHKLQCCRFLSILSSFVVFQAQVLYDFTAEPGNNELSVREGETVTVLYQVRTHIHTDSIYSVNMRHAVIMTVFVCADCGWRLDWSPELQRTNRTGTWGIFTGEQGEFISLWTKDQPLPHPVRACWHFLRHCPWEILHSYSVHKETRK